MAWDWTTTGLLVSIRQKAYLPDGHPSFTDAVLLKMADEELRDTILPAIQTRHEDFYTRYYDHTVTANQQRYRLPYRASYGVLRKATMLAADGRMVGDLVLDTQDSIDSYAGITAPPDAITTYALEGDTVVLLPTPSATSGTLRLRYYRRPSKLVLTSAVQTITAINTTTKQLTFSSNAYTTSSVLDFVQATPGFDVLSMDVTPTSTDATKIIMSALPTDLAVGDYVCISGETPVPQLPADFHSILAQATAVKVLEQLNDSRLQYADAKLRNDLAQALNAITPRNHGAARKIINRNSPLRSRR